MSGRSISWNLKKVLKEISFFDVWTLEESKMKKLLVLATVLLVLPVTLNAGTVVFDGDAGIYGLFYATADVVAGETYCDVVGPANFGFISTLCDDVIDTFCMHYYDDLGWTIVADANGPEGECWELDSGYTFDVEVCVTVPCEGSTPGTVNNVCAMMAYCDVYEVCQPDSGDCENPNDWSGDPVYNTTCVELTIVPTPPALYVLQDTLYLVEVGLTAAYVPFGICNGDPCSPPMDYGYHFWSLGYIGTALDETGTALGVGGGLCHDVYGILNAGEAEVCDYDTLTIIAWSTEGDIIYDTCVQVVHIVEPVDVPLFSTPVVTILVLAMILAAAVIMKRTAASKA